MTSSADFIQFWQSIVVDSAMEPPLRHYAGAVLLACPSSCDAERAISTLNRIVTALRNRLSWPMIRMHLIGAEDVVEEGYPYNMVAESWGATPRQRRRASQNVRKPRKDTGRRSKDSNTLPASGEYTDNLAEMSDGASSLSSFASITTGSSSGSGSDSDNSDNSEMSSSHSSSEQDNLVT